MSHHAFFAVLGTAGAGEIWYGRHTEDEGSMREVGDIRARAGEIMQSMLLRPGMYGSGQSFEWTVRSQLTDLAFIDEREDDLADLFKELEHDGLWGALGAWGVLAGLFGPGDHTHALAALYVPIASRLGYFEPRRRLSGDDWAELRNSPDWATRAARTRPDVEARFGPPSYRGDGQQPGAFGYNGSVANAWVTFHFGNGLNGELQWIHLHEKPAGSAFVDLRSAPKEILTPEDIYRAFLTATYSGSEPDVRKHILLHPHPSVLWSDAYPTDVARLLAEQVRTMSVIRVNPPDSVVYLISEACPVPLAVVKTDAGWVVDADPLVRFLGNSRAIA